jgi:hypothetical protein
MYEIYEVYNKTKDYVRLQMEYITLSHVIGLIAITIITSTLIKIRLLRWIYVGVMIVTASSMYNDGKIIGVGENIISLAII